MHELEIVAGIQNLTEAIVLLRQLLDVVYETLHADASLHPAKIVLVRTVPLTSGETRSNTAKSPGGWLSGGAGADIDPDILLADLRQITGHA